LNTKSHNIIYTIGHSNLEIADFLALLKAAGVQVLVDIRSAPYSKYVSQYDYVTFHTAVEQGGIEYCYLGRELGGRPEDDTFYDAEGRVLYGEYKDTPEFKAGIEKLVEISRAKLAAVICSEENPFHCHRRLLVGRYLAELGCEIRHIRRGGVIQSERDLLDDERIKQFGALQENLFDSDEALGWKSIPSVSPARVRNSFSGS